MLVHWRSLVGYRRIQVCASIGANAVARSYTAANFKSSRHHIVLELSIRVVLSRRNAEDHCLEMSSVAWQPDLRRTRLFILDKRGKQITSVYIKANPE